MNIRLTAAAVAVASLFSAAALAHEAEHEQAEIIVSATRFGETRPKAPVAVTVVTREDIARSAATSVPDLLKSTVGVVAAPLYGPLGIDAGVDVRGFGESATSNTLVLLDGQRLNPVDLGNINWSEIPLANVQRIEVVRGGGGVLYGDRAVGGVINIITDKSGKPRANASATLGSYGYHRLDASASGMEEDVYFNVAASYADVNGWRENTTADQRALSGRLGRYLGHEGEIFIDLGVFGDSSGTPGALNAADYSANPRKAAYPTYDQKHDGFRVRPGLRYDLSPTLSFEVELSHAESRLNSNSFGSNYVADTDATALTPRLRWRHGLGGLASESVGGVDVFRGTTSSVAGSSLRDASQRSRAFYLQNTTSLRSDLHVTLGARRHVMEQRSSDSGSGSSGEATLARNAYEAGLAWDVNRQTRLFTRWNQVFRFASTDELFGFDPFTYLPLYTSPTLRPQHGRNVEVGGSWQGRDVRLQATVYRLNLTDEIGYDALNGANVNLPRTRREGVELEARWKALPVLELLAGVGLQHAKFVEGADAGKELPLAPRQKYTAGVQYDAAAFGRYAATWTHVGSRRFGSDFANAGPVLDGYDVLDLTARWKLRDIGLQLKLANVTNQKYAPYARYAFNAASYYPAEPRSVFLTASYAFR